MQRTGRPGGDAWPLRVGRGSSGDTGAGYIPSMRAIAPAITLVIHPHVTSPQDRFTRPLARRDFRKERPSRAYTACTTACTQVCARPVLCGMSWKANVRPRPSGDAPQIRHTAMARLPGSLPSARAAVRAVRPTRSMNPTTASAWDRWDMSATPQPMWRWLARPASAHRATESSARCAGHR
jgi:hypothetical protein